MNKMIIGSIAALLSFGAAACGSSTSSSTATTANSSTAASTAASSSAAGALGAKQAAVLTKTEAELDQAGLKYDVACMSKLIAQLSDADADLIVSAVPPATVTASPAGEAIGKQIVSCVTPPSTDAVPTT